jgi:hypothetical protein
MILTEENLWPTAALSATNPTWISLWLNPGLRVEKLETNLLRHGMVADYMSGDSLSKM